MIFHKQHICYYRIGMPIDLPPYFSFKPSHIFKWIICLFFFENSKIVIIFPFCALWLIISSYVLKIHLLILSASLHNHRHIFLYDRWLSIFLFICLLYRFYIVNRKNKFLSIYYFVQGFYWIILSVFLKQGYAFIQ